MSLLSVSALARESIPFSICARPERCIAEVERHTYFQLSGTYRNDWITQAVLLYVELMEAGIEPRTFRLQGERSTDWANRPQTLKEQTIFDEVLQR